MTANQDPRRKPEPGGCLPVAHLDCTVDDCKYCKYGAWTCVVCNAHEGERPSECPGVPLTDAQVSLIVSGDMDYRAGKWRSEPSRHTDVGFEMLLEAERKGEAVFGRPANEAWMVDRLGACPPVQFFFHRVPCVCEQRDNAKGVGNADRPE